MTDAKELRIIPEAIDKIRNAQNNGLIEQHIHEALLELQSCGATKRDAAAMLLSGVVDADNQNPNLSHASRILETLK
jgi:hypothetical protein